MGMENPDLQRELNKAVAAFGGLCSAIGRYMDGAGVPEATSPQKRVKILALMYARSVAENRELRCILEETE